MEIKDAQLFNCFAYQIELCSNDNRTAKTLLRTNAVFESIFYQGNDFDIYSLIIKHMALIAADIRGRHKRMNTNKNLYNRATTSSNDVTDD